MERILRILPLVLLAAGLAIAGHAQEISFTATVDKSEIGAGDPVQLTVTLSNARGRISAPDLGGMVVLAGPFSSSNITNFNGRFVSTESFTWRITATRPGTYTIGPARVQVGGGIIETDPITIKVGPARAGSPAPELSQGQQRDANLFITISLSSRKGYVGEQVVATYTLYSRYANVDLAEYDLPQLNGFWAEEVDLGNSNWEPAPQTVNGLQYRVAVLKRQVLFPQRPGTLRIEPFAISAVVDRSFFNRGRTIQVKSNAVEFTALGLPPGAPADFTGSVGDLQMTVKADRTEVTTDEAIEITVRLSGRSNLKLLEGPEVSFPSDFEVYDPKVNDKITVNSSGMSGHREFQYLVIPRYEGLYELPPITFSYFDAKAGAYKTLRSDGLTVEVAPGQGGRSAVVQRPLRTDVDVVGTDIRYIRTGATELRGRDEFLFGAPHWWAGMGAPALAFMLLLVWRRKREREAADVQGLRRRKADKVARERLKQAQQALQNKDREAFHGALGKALQGYLGDKLELGVAELNASSIAARLGHGEEGRAIADAFATLIATCDMARFAPVEERPRQDLYDQAAQLIGRTEQLLRS